jgi:thiol-disulfide isomerase/thioredoxin
MKFILLCTLSLFIHQLGSAQDFVRELDRKTETVLLRGKISFDDISKETSCSWLDQRASAYEPNRQHSDLLNKIAGDYRFVVFAGTWCSDTKDLLPKFYKVLVESGIDLRAVEMYGVNRNKEALNIEHTFYNIRYVPTFIVMHQAREVGRIVESVSTSIEEELVNLIAADYEKRMASRSETSK